MLIGILETGKVNEALVEKHGAYPPMFERLLGLAGPDLKFRAYSVVDGVLPESPAECDAWLITGSRHGVYDDLPWIEPLKAFLRAAREAGRPLIGICFGHQILAEALGGKAVKSEKGWGIGVQDYAVVRRPGWMADAPERLSFHAIHQDQVVALPPDATPLATSPFCEHAFIAYGDPEAPDAISIQPHPEFDAEYGYDLVAMGKGVRFTEDEAERAMATYGSPVHADDFARWCVNYLAAFARRRGAQAA
ncbi:MAG: type 1 glutamine amidotransferase [Thermohalobaculum sp.]|nr:type 1 glutamine amidotransferase [Thermohalobaculum sp.]